PKQATIVEWLGELYPIWVRLDAELEYAAARAALAALALSGCTTTVDHHYVFPRGAGDLLDAGIEAARQIGLRFHACRGSMDLGRSRGGLPPDEAPQDPGAILAATATPPAPHPHAPSNTLRRIALAPPSPV